MHDKFEFWNLNLKVIYWAGHDMNTVKLSVTGHVNKIKWNLWIMQKRCMQTEAIGLLKMCMSKVQTATIPIILLKIWLFIKLGLYFPSCSAWRWKCLGCLTTSTGQWQWWTRKSLTEPNRVRRTAPCPREPTTTSWACSHSLMMPSPGRAAATLFTLPPSCTQTWSWDVG